MFGHGFVTFKGQKMSKSLGTVLDPLDAAAKFGPDPLRLYLVKEIPYGQDGDFSWERFEERYNVDLANNLGNLVNRLAAMTDAIARDACPPLPAPRAASPAWPSDVVRRYRAAMETYALHEAAFAAFGLIDAANEYIAETEPWTLARQGQQERLTQVLSDVVEAVRIAAVLLLPVMPESCAEILRRMGEDRSAGRTDAGSRRRVDWRRPRAGDHEGGSALAEAGGEDHDRPTPRRSRSLPLRVRRSRQPRGAGPRGAPSGAASARRRRRSRSTTS